MFVNRFGELYGHKGRLAHRERSPAIQSLHSDYEKGDGDHADQDRRQHEAEVSQVETQQASLGSPDDPRLIPEDAEFEQRCLDLTPREANSILVRNLADDPQHGDSGNG